MIRGVSEITADHHGGVVQQGAVTLLDLIELGEEPVQVLHDVDLDPSLNPDSDLFVEALYIAHDDPNPGDNMIHEPVTITSGTPGQTWQFSLSEPGQIGPAILAWSGSTISR